MATGVYDPCFGTAGFLAESAEYIRRTADALSGSQFDRLQRATLYGIELKSLTYLLGTMNMLLHRIEGANLAPGNTLELHTSNPPENDRYDVILSNPPYGGKMARELQSNFTIPSGSTEILFLQHIMANLATGGRAAVIVPEGVLFRGGPDARVRKRLLQDFDVHTILSLPAGCFLPYTAVKTNVLFFTRCHDGGGTKEVWYYELTNDGFNLKSTRRPIKGSQIPDFLSKWQKRLDGDNSWTVSIREIVEQNWDISARNPTKEEGNDHTPVLELIQSMRTKEERIIELLRELEELMQVPE